MGERHVLVTGGSRGLGLALATALLGQGYRVSTCSRRPSEGLERLAESPAGRERLFWSACEVGREEQETAFFAQAMAWAGGAGKLFALVNNAAVAGEGVLASFPTVDAARILEVNLLGALRMSRLALRELLIRPGPGRIVQIGSILGSRGATGLTAYAAAKAGLEGLTRSMAREVGRRGVTVNTVAPGFLATEMTAGLSPERQAQLIRRTPLGRLGEVSDVVPVILFLLSDGAAFVTGQTLVVDGGMTC
ncbi:MAG: SDR family oxidoreductase [Magnetococcales bacterium]|nr:SDR family oxidoreductase [Magnetococcales bacterium]